ncbi:MAG: glycosyltransferase family 39 protein [Candidatus Latescibacterota bacterium]|nr:MAG: glycosyltransferase family 39 protein [Candidatus Latescibacterota bacterium]
MIASKWSRESRVVLPILLVALAVRLHKIGWGLPFVLEEATPLKMAWAMWGWGMPAGVDLNPHFFNYPSLTIYIHFVAQGILYLLMKIGGLAGSAADYHARYLVDPTPFYYVGRSLSALFGVGTVWLTWLVGWRIAGRWAGIAGAALMAVNVFHVSRSQMIEVDLPLTFFVVLALWFLLRQTERRSLMIYLLAGAAVGFAVSTKYTGAILLYPLFVAHLLAIRKDRGDPNWSCPVLSVCVAAGVFVLTSPFVVLDAGTFFEHIGAERQHMRLGHFGLDSSSSGIFYLRSLVGTLLGWPATILAFAGLVYFTVVRRQAAALVLAAFLIPYLLAVLTWAMHADRYLLPVIPLFVTFAVALPVEVFSKPPASRWPHWIRVGAIAALVVVLAIPAVAGYPSYLRSIRRDTRTEAAKWIEANIPSGSYFVVEPYGPELFGPQKISQLGSAMRRKVLELKKDTPNYAVLWVPMFQVRPERSEVFYDHSLYENADYIVSTGAARSRYAKEPARFRRQLAFYDSLETGYEKIAKFTPAGGGGSVITVYKNPHHGKQFSKREEVAPPRPLRHRHSSTTGSEELFYFNLGINYEIFLRLPEAIASYDLAFRYGVGRPTTFKNLVLRKTHCLMMLGRVEEAVGYLQTMIPKAPTPGVREHLQKIRDAIRRGETSGSR